MKLTIYILFLIHCFFPYITHASELSKANAPYYNPYLANSSYSLTHTASDFTPIAGPVDLSRRLKNDEIKWKSVGPVNTWAPMYSAPYPNDKRVIWVGGYDRIAKLDAETLDVLTTHTIDGAHYFRDEEITRHINKMDELDDKEMSEYSVNLWKETFPHAVTFYRFLSNENELYIPYIAPDRSISLRVYGEANTKDPASKISLQREWPFPTSLSKAAGIIGIGMTPDGWVIIVTTDGLVVALSRDFTDYKTLKLPQNDQENSISDLFAAFVRNGIATDDQGGIYIVSRDYMHRIQWTGDKLSLDEKDGAWSSNYPNNSGLGSGTTPGLMGWGETEDHLIVIADGSRSNNTIAFWRDKIPSDWQGLEDLNRRVAGIAPIRFNNDTETQSTRVENAPIIYGYGVFFNNTFPETRLPDQGGPGQQWLAESFYMHVPKHGAHGGAMIRWDSQTRQLIPAWQTDINLVSSVCTVSGGSEMLYCWGARDREWTLEALDWKTGHSQFHYTLGASHRFNPLGGPIIVAPNGDVDCGCAGGMGLVRISPEN